MFGKENTLTEHGMIFPSPFNSGVKCFSEPHVELVSGLKATVAFLQLCDKKKKKMEMTHFFKANIVNGQ